MRPTGKILALAVVWGIAGINAFPVPGVCDGPAGALDKVLNRMEQADASLKTIQFKFRQSADIVLTGDRQKIQGSAAFKKPNKFRIEHKTPAEQTVVSNGQRLWFYNADRNQVFVDSWKNWSASAGFPEGLMTFQRSMSDLKREYKITLEEYKTPDMAVIKLIPVKSDLWPYVFTLWVDMNTGMPVKTRLESKSVVSITELSDVKINSEIKDTQFNFKIPPEADIVDQAAAMNP